MSRNVAAYDLKLAVRALAHRLINTTSDFQADQHDVRVTWTGQTAWTNFRHDPKRYGARKTPVAALINVPAIKETALLSRGEADRLAAYVLHELGHVFWTDLKLYRQARQDHGVFGKQLLNGLEDPLIEHKLITSRWAPGSQSLFLALANNLLASALDNPQFDANHLGAAPFLLAIFGRAELSGHDIRTAADVWTQIADARRAWFRKGLDGLRRCGATQDCYDLMVELIRDIKETTPDVNDGLPEAGEDQQGKANEQKSPEDADKRKSGGDEKAEAGENDKDQGDDDEADEENGQGQSKGESQDSGDSEGNDAGDAGEESGEGEGQGQDGGDSEGEAGDDGQGPGQGEGGEDDTNDEHTDDGEEGGAGGDGRSAGAGQWTVNDLHNLDEDDLVPVEPDSNVEELAQKANRRDSEEIKQEVRLDFEPDEEIDCTGLCGDWEQAKAKVPRGMAGLEQKLWRLLYAPERGGWDRGENSGRLDRKSYHKLLAGSERVFARRWETRGIETVVSILIDLSGSMRGDKIVQAQTMAVKLSEILDKAGVMFEVVGFCDPNHPGDNIPDPHRGTFLDKATPRYIGRNISSCRLAVFKRFNERLRHRRGALAAISGQANHSTYDYAGIRTCIDRLVPLKQERKVLFVLTDGEGEGAAAIRDACRLAKWKGIDVVGVGLMHDVSKQYDLYINVQKAEDLAGKAMDILIQQVERYHVGRRVA